MIISSFNIFDAMFLCNMLSSSGSTRTLKIRHVKHLNIMFHIKNDRHSIIFLKMVKIMHDCLKIMLSTLIS